MANIEGVTGNIPKVRHTYKKVLSYGEGVVSDEFIMVIEEYPDLRYLIQSTQIPALMRENVESYGPFGVQFNQQGRYKNAQDVPIAFKEVIAGHSYKAIRDWVKNKRYLTVRLGLAGESYPNSPGPLTWVFEDCWLELEGADLSVEDGASLVRPSGTLHINWVSHLDEDGSKNYLSMEG